MSGSFTADGDTEFSFAVRKLADRFLLEGLCDLVRSAEYGLILGGLCTCNFYQDLKVLCIEDH